MKGAKFAAIALVCLLGLTSGAGAGWVSGIFAPWIEFLKTDVYPSGAVEGTIFWHDTGNVLQLFDGSAWLTPTFSGGSPSFVNLTATGTVASGLTLTASTEVISPTAGVSANPSLNWYDQAGGANATRLGVRGTYFQGQRKWAVATYSDAGAKQQDLLQISEPGHVTITGPLRVSMSSAASPTYANGGDIDTGFYFPATSQAGIAVDGAQVVGVTASGLTATNLLIGGTQVVTAAFWAP